ncbi:MAG: DNRLRE domain-containing protein [Candidatus Aenigmatarchaeota archaeon]
MKNGIDKGRLFLSLMVIAGTFLLTGVGGVSGYLVMTDTIQPDSGGKDAHMISGSPNFNYGADTGMDIRGDDNRRALIEFNLSNASAYTNMISATMRLYATAKGSADPVVYVHRVTNPWVEGSGTGSKTGDGVTWNNRSGSQAWTSSGGDYDQNIITNTTVTGTNAWFSWDVTDLVRGWANGTYSNYGLLIRTNTTSSATTTFSTSDNANSSRRPVLEIRYFIPLNIGFVSPTPDSGSTVNQTWVYVNVTLSNGNATAAKLEFNGTNYTMSNASATPGVRWFYNKTNMANGNYTYRVYANDTDNRVFYNSSVRTVTVNVYTDSTPPQWSNANSSTPATYSTTSSSFNVAWTDNAGISIALFESNYSGTATNYTMSGSGTYSYSAVLPAGTFYWKSYANDTSGNRNSTGIRYFTIGRADNPVNLYLNGNRNSNITIAYGTQSNATGTAQAGTATMFRNDASIGNPETAIFGVNAAGHAYKVNATGNANYSDNTTGITYYLIISKAASAASLTFSPASPVSYGTATTARCSSTNPEGAARLYRDGTDVTTENNTAIILGAGTYGYVCNASATQNYTAANSNSSYVVNKAATTTALLIDGTQADKTVTYGTQTNVTATTSTGSLTLYRNGLVVSNPDITNLGNGTYNYTAYNYGNANFSGSSVTRWVTVGSMTSSVLLMLDGQQADLSVTAGDSVNITAVLVSPAAGNLNLAMDGTTIDSGPSPLQNITLFANAGTFFINASYAGNANYTPANAGLYVTVQNSKAPSKKALVVQAGPDACLRCPPLTDWSACADGKQTRTAYDCASTTAYRCIPRTEENACTNPAPPIVQENRPAQTAQGAAGNANNPAGGTAPLAAVTGAAGAMPGLELIAGLAILAGGIGLVWMRRTRHPHRPSKRPR